MKTSGLSKKQQASAQRSNQPFFGSKSTGNFFSKAISNSTSFFQNSRSAIQAKLTVGAVGDKYEQEADRVAADVVAKINDSSSSGAGDQQSVQRMEMEDEELKMKPMVQRIGTEGGAVSTDFENQLNVARGGGQSLAPDLQAKMGQAMGADFSGVRIHTDARSDQLNQSIQAKAFTTGQDVFFRQGAYQPQSRGGQELIAHELTHVVHQSGSAVLNPSVMSKTIQRNPDHASTIASGHAFKKHVLGKGRRGKKEWGDPPSVTRAEFAAVVQDVMDSPDEARNLSDGRKAYWKGDIVVIYNPGAGDKGTCFKPDSGKAYYDRLV